MKEMFNGATSFNQDLSSWNVDKVGRSCTAFFGVSAGAWTLPKPAFPVYCLGFTAATNGVTVLCPDAAVGDVGVFNGVEYTKRDRDGLRKLVGTSEEAKLAKSCTTGVTDMSFMFNGATSFNQDISKWDTSSMTTMTSMFNGATSFNHDISKWNTAAVTNMRYMFYEATSFNQDISKWDTSSVTTMEYMFFRATSFNQDISKWNTHLVRDMQWMFAYAVAFNQNIEGWNTGSVKLMNRMFQGATSFNQDISGWNTAAVTNMQGMFYEATSFNQDISKWSTGSVTDMKYMFYGATGFDRDLSAWNVANVGSTCGLFDANAVKWSQPKPALPDSCIGFRMAANGVTVLCPDARVGDRGAVNGVTYTKRDRDGLRSLVGAWNEAELAKSCTTGVMYMSSLFKDASTFNQDISKWDTSSVMTMQSMFDGATSFNRDISKWDTSSVTSMQSMFNGATTFNQDLSSWNIDKVGSSCTSFETNTGAWALPKPAFPSSCVRFSIPAGRHVILCPEAVVGDSGVLNDVRYTKRDLAGLRRLVGTSEEAKLATSCTSGVTDMSFLFKDASTFNQDISKWDTSSVSNMEGMFAGTTSFNQDIRWWNTAAVTNMRYMFDGARAFNQNLIYWNVERASCFGFNRNSRSWALNKPALPAYCLGFTIATNRVTMLCPDARVGDTVVINGAEYMKRDRAGLLALLGTAKEGDLAISCTTGVTDMSSLFKDASSFNVKIGSWDTSSVTTMQSMFNGASTFNQDISKWNTGKVTNMQSMFDGATSFNQDLSSWNVVKVGRSCTAFFDVSAGAWTLPKPALPASCIGFYLAANRVTVLCPDAAVGDVGVINGVEYMKRSQAGLRRLVGIRSEEAKLATSCTTGVTDMSFMFYAATSFDQDISKWDTGSVTTMASMFLHAASFNQDISKWDTSSVTTMNSMFYEATSFNQDLSSWNIDKVGSSCTRFETNAGAWTLPKPALPASCIAFGFAANGVTVLCPDAAVGDRGVFNGVEYTKRDRDGLRKLVGTSEEAKLAKSCTTGVTDMSSCSMVPLHSTRTSASGTRAR